MKLAIICSIPDDRPLRSTLARALKALLRRYQVRCIDIRDEPATPPTPAAEPRQRRQLSRELGRGEDDGTRQDTPRPPGLAPIGAPDARSGVKPTQTTSEGGSCGKSGAGGSNVHGCRTGRGSVLPIDAPDAPGRAKRPSLPSPDASEGEKGTLVRPNKSDAGKATQPPLSRGVGSRGSVLSMSDAGAMRSGDHNGDDDKSEDQ